MTMTMGQIIKNLRKGRGLTQEALAERLGVTYQAISKWENDYGMPDISQIVPLATIFDVSTDFLFGIDPTSETEDALKIVSTANGIQEYGKLDTYLKAYDVLLDGLKKHPNNYIITYNCMNLGVSLSLPDNGWLYAKERAEAIIHETIRQADFIIANSKNISDVLWARQNLVFLYSANDKFDLATTEARNFPVRTDLTLYSTMAIVNEYMGDHEREVTCLCSDIDYSLQAFENNIARLGKAYYKNGKYTDAIDVYERFFAVMKAIFKDECPPPYHDFDSGDCYLLLAQAYLAIGETDKAMDSVEKSIMYYIDLLNRETDEENCYPIVVCSPIVRKREFKQRICREIIKKKLQNKLSDQGIEKLNQHSRFIHLLDIVNSISE
ncbi:MAG: helix-turn-helix domain-containing protein [Clostridia bacterium]|nr:helix-turn-helix domain-containing protein [Clostridia bacterium]